MADFERVTIYQCEACGEIVSEDRRDEAGPLYECGDCGTRFTRQGSQDSGSHRCPDCGKFGGKAADHACPDCEEGELIAEEGLQCGDCGEVGPLPELRKETEAPLADAMLLDSAKTS